MATASDLQQLYVGYFGRAADQEGLNFWLEAINNGGLSLDNVHASFVQSEEYQAQYEGLSSSDLVAQVYLNVLGRPAEAEGLAFWADALDTGTITEDQLIEGLLSGLSPRDALIISNKVTVANYYTAVRGAEYNEADKAASGDILVGVNGDVASVAAALQDIADNVEGPGASNDELAAALANLQAAVDAQEAYAEAVLGDDAATSADVVGDAATAISDALDNAVDNLNDAITAVGATAIAAGDSQAIVQVRLAEANTAAASAVTTAQNAVNAVPGLNVAASNYVKALAANEAAVDAAAAAQTEEDAELARFNVLNGTTGAGALTVDADTGEVSGVLAVVAGNLVVASAYLTATGRTDAQKEAANALLADVQARLAADEAAENAEAAAVTAAERVVALDDTIDSTDIAADGFTLTDGLVADLIAARADQTALAEAVVEFNEASAAAAEWAELGDAIVDAGDAITDLGFDLVQFSASVTATADDEVFVFTGTAATGAATITGFAGDDVLFVGTGYVQGTDSDLTAPGIQGGNNAALEVFFTQAGANVVVSIETSEFGSNVGGGAAPEFHAITLTGVTVDQLSFDASTGFVSLV
ncbi:DUF4214 domain-containing protein [Stutzerimonas stutzeri]|uniref:DUF4214 domain-containing protein n=1 Tax=Stutzerimonas stutzeri TaxID=316 RepID=UPI00244B5FDC|nr:DUF4214 domain-containing protein [Stutzerimonas stutzeri]MDH0212193.1 DUF4214 domain-containing protein [Stutzerimonas stutzeri]MDH0258232.1 DUF4214 domain-containing protein [Stutzerimonas stutzeri]MDH0503581.1 DUF4214 domain-containing protein [Stutzerimonas stutzeri]